MSESMDERMEKLYSEMSLEDIERAWDCTHISQAMAMAHRDHHHLLHFLLWRYLRWLRRTTTRP